MYLDRQSKLGIWHMHVFRLLRGDFAVHQTRSPYKSLEELWDGEI